MLWGLQSRSVFAEAGEGVSISSRRSAWVSPTDTQGIIPFVSTSSKSFIYSRISVIFPRSFELSPGIFESFSAIFCNCSCDMLIFLYILWNTVTRTIYPKFIKSSMSLKNILQSTLSNPKEYIEILYTSSKVLFITLAVLFFVSYFCISAKFYDTLFFQFFLALYISFIVSFEIFVCILIWKYAYKKLPSLLIIFLNILVGMLGIFFLLPLF